MDLISVIVPIYKVEPYLKQCVDSIRQQSYQNLEIILVDDGSPDGCGAICDDYAKKDSRIRVIHKQNAGLGMARNSGLEIATGKYVMFIDSDDWIEPDMVSIVHEVAKAHSAEMVICGYRALPQNGVPREHPVCGKVEHYEGAAQIVQKILAPIIGPKRINGSEDVQEMSACTTLYSMNVIRDYNLQFVNEREYLSEDFFFNISYIKSAKVVVRIPDLLYWYRYNETSLSNRYRPERVKLLNNLMESAIELLKREGIYDSMSDRLNRTYIKKLRHSLIHISQEKLTNREKRDLYMDALKYVLGSSILAEYPKSIVPLKERILVTLIEKQQVPLMHAYLKLQLIYIATRENIKRLGALRKKRQEICKPQNKRADHAVE